MTEDPIGPVRAVAVGDGYIVSGGQDGSVRLWELDTVTPLRVLHTFERPVLALAFAGSRLIGSDGNAVWEWEPPDGPGRETRVRRRYTASVAAVAAQARLVAAGWADSVVLLRPDGEDAVPGEHGRFSVQSIAATPDGGVVVAGGGDGTILVWDRVQGAVDVLTGRADVRAVAVGGDGRLVLSGDSAGAVRLWDRTQGAVTAEFPTHRSTVTTVALSGDGTFAVSGDSTGILLVHHVAAPDKPLELHGHTGAVRAVVCTADQHQLVSAGADGIRVWNRVDGVQTGGTGFVVSRPRPRAGLTSDRETGVDLVGFHEDVRTLSSVIADRATTPPLCIALLGPWGSGKSSFMLQVSDRVTRLAEAAARHPNPAVYASSIRQIRFNAWQYHDDHLWVGLVEHLIGSLAAPTVPDEAGARAERDRLRDRLADIEARRSALDTAGPAGKLVGGLVGGIDAAQRRARRRALVTGTLLTVCLGVAAVLGWLAWQEALLAAAAGLVAAVAVLTSVTEAGRWLLRPLTAGSARLRALAAARAASLDEQARLTAEQLRRVDAAERLTALVEQARSGRYEQYRGLLGRVHEDLESLSDYLAHARAEWERDGSVGPPPLERIVLYVDDLDRCAPAKVVDVLAAVHLLLALPLFVVVVAVDPQWLLRCLRAHQAELFGTEGQEPAEYLDKIFQVVFALQPLGPQANTLINELMSSPEQVAVPGAGADPLPVTPPVRSPEPEPEPPVASPGHATYFDLKPDRLRLTSAEREFVHRLRTALRTPRAIRKLVNLYRLVRIGIPDAELAVFITGPHQAVLVLLALLVVDPAAARTTLLRLADGEPVESALPQRWRDIAGGRFHGDTATYRAWAPTIARFSFDTYDLMAEPGTSTESDRP